ncbi:putative sporulation protein YtxC [Gehongia tenuis]|uniref:Sporulation protein YtxC n=1 Tax=Gehongia tenuis TaxID=2763655 RepID=A0A926HPB1_9FIRM|nr:putative sporulation protein YtxC [Gehongia tenuis]MBC8531033.1 putative sporulation protein YtxC [Gehongia tenuis]
MEYRIGVREDTFDLQGILADRADDYKLNACFEMDDDGCLLHVPEEKRREVSVLLADVIMNGLPQNMVSKLIEKYCSSFNAYDRWRIEHMVLDSWQDMKENHGAGFARWSLRVTDEVEDYLLTSKEMMLDGFVRFRLKDWVRYWEQKVKRAAEELLIEREYMQFIRLLRIFVDTQEPKIDRVNITLDANGQYLLTDGQGEPIEDETLFEMEDELSRMQLGKADILLSSLITISPGKVHMDAHVARDAEVMETIRQVFQARLVIDQEP